MFFRQFCELAGRVEPIIADLILAMVELGVPITGLNEFARRRTAKAVTTPGQVIQCLNYSIRYEK